MSGKIRQEILKAPDSINNSITKEKKQKYKPIKFDICEENREHTIKLRDLEDVEEVIKSPNHLSDRVLRLLAFINFNKQNILENKNPEIKKFVFIQIVHALRDIVRFFKEINVELPVHFVRFIDKVIARPFHKIKISDNLANRPGAYISIVDTIIFNFTSIAVQLLMQNSNKGDHAELLKKLKEYNSPQEFLRDNEVKIRYYLMHEILHALASGDFELTVKEGLLKDYVRHSGFSGRESYPENVAFNEALTDYIVYQVIKINNPESIHEIPFGYGDLLQAIDRMIMHISKAANIPPQKVVRFVVSAYITRDHDRFFNLITALTNDTRIKKEIREKIKNEYEYIISKWFEKYDADNGSIM